MSTANQILDQVTVLLTRIRARTVALDGVERGLESISFNLRQLASRPACCGTLAQFPLKSATDGKAA
jgi:hypothetical protein